MYDYICPLDGSISPTLHIIMIIAFYQNKVHQLPQFVGMDGHVLSQQQHYSECA